MDSPDHLTQLDPWYKQPNFWIIALLNLAALAFLGIFTIASLQSFQIYWLSMGGAIVSFFAISTLVMLAAYIWLKHDSIFIIAGAMHAILLSLALYSFTNLYGGEVEASIKSPVFLYYFILIALYNLHARPMILIATAVTSIIGWFVVCVTLIEKRDLGLSYFDMVMRDGISLYFLPEQMGSLIIVSILLIAHKLRHTSRD